MFRNKVGTSSCGFRRDTVSSEPKVLKMDDIVSTESRCQDASPTCWKTSSVRSDVPRVENTFEFSKCLLREVRSNQWKNLPSAR